MKVAYCSDLHLEFKSIELNNEGGAEVLILAGDIYLIYRMHDDMVDTFNSFINHVASEFKHVIYVTGNHEYYDANINDIQKLRDVVNGYDNVHVLDNESIIIDGIKFVGGTMWTDMKKDDQYVKRMAPYAMNDFRIIEGLTPELSIEKFHAFNNYLETEKPVDVVVTHHGPSWSCIGLEYIGSKYNPMYVSDVDVSDVKYWVYGHLHTGNSFEQDGCNIVTNARGYPSEPSFHNFRLKYFIVE